jgi:hypothetical protein
LFQKIFKAAPTPLHALCQTRPLNLTGFSRNLVCEFGKFDLNYGQVHGMIQRSATTFERIKLAISLAGAVFASRSHFTKISSLAKSL